ncbi:RING finger protein 32-like [Plakobranchus ocellatus]|uniref:RING finger protein 32-like n=1 Tax=Plakobranchus ocellatus TaxID=259542 RepID=A0AAV3ZWW6_9GAST|nr:RING finger protein 32-like [Plakobranchus ocellatus]
MTALVLYLLSLHALRLSCVQGAEEMAEADSSCRSLRVTSGLNTGVKGFVLSLRNNNSLTISSSVVCVSLAFFTWQVANKSSVALTAMALQDHWTRTLSLGTSFGPRKVGVGPATMAKQKLKKDAKPVVDTGRSRGKKEPEPQQAKSEVEYVLDEKPPPLTLAQKFGLVEAPKQLLSESEWSGIKAKSNKREDSGEPCVICKEDFGLQEQVILSCSHVFHRACLQAFERFTGRKSCPMCRHEQYQTRVIHEGARVYRHKAVIRVQAAWRGYVVRSWYKKLRETVPPKDPLLKKKFYEEKLTAIVDRMINSVDINMSDFLQEIDSSVQQSRAIFSQWDAVHNPITPEMWEAIQLKAVERGDTECPICLTELHLSTNASQSTTQSKEDTAPRKSQHQPKQQQEQQQDQTSRRTTPNPKLRRKLQDQKLLQKLSRDTGSSQDASDSTCSDSDIHTLHGDNETKKTVSFDSSVGDKTKRDSEDSETGLPQAEEDGSPLRCRNQHHATFVTQSKQELEGSTSNNRPRRIRATVLLSCTHVFHSTCLHTLEEMAMVDMRNSCPVCRAHYQKKVIVF